GAASEAFSGACGFLTPLSRADGAISCGASVRGADEGVIGGDIRWRSSLGRFPFGLGLFAGVVGAEGVTDPAGFSSRQFLRFPGGVAAGLGPGVDEVSGPALIAGAGAGVVDVFGANE